jgi:hypothetical protein
MQRDRDGGSLGRKVYRGDEREALDLSLKYQTFKDVPNSTKYKFEPSNYAALRYHK